MPFQTPCESGWEKPARPTFTPHCTWPLWVTASRVDCAAAGAAHRTESAAITASAGFMVPPRGRVYGRRRFSRYPSRVKLAANLSLLFPQLPFPERFAAAAKAGFRYVEYQF